MTPAAISRVRGKPISCRTCRVTTISFFSSAERTVGLPAPTLSLEPWRCLWSVLGIAKRLEAVVRLSSFFCTSAKAASSSCTLHPATLLRTYLRGIIQLVCVYCTVVYYINLLAPGATFDRYTARCLEAVSFSEVASFLDVSCTCMGSIVQFTAACLWLIPITLCLCRNENTEFLRLPILRAIATTYHNSHVYVAPEDTYETNTAVLVTD